MRYVTLNLLTMSKKSVLFLMQQTFCCIHKVYVHWHHLSGISGTRQCGYCWVRK